jgi:hypothetical protein
MEEPEWVDAFQGASVADLDWHRRKQEGPREVAEPDSWTPRNLAELEDRPPVQPELGGLGLVYPGKRHVFSGPQESAKTLAAYVVGLSVVRSGGRVVLIDFEMGPWDAKTRLRELGARDDEIAQFAYVEPDTPSTPERVGALVDLEPRLVLVDAAAGAFQLEGLDDNARRDVERWASAWVTPFWKAGIATIVLDHVTKNAETRGTYAIGSERKVGGADVHLGFSVITPIRRGSHGRYQITTHKDRGGCLKRGKLATFELASDPETHHFTWAFVPAPVVDEEHEFRPTAIMEKVSRFVAVQSEPVTQRRIRDEKFGKTAYVADAIRILEREGYITVTELPNKTLVEHVRSYLESEDLSGSLSGSQWFPKDEIVSGSLVPPPYRGEPGEPHTEKREPLTGTTGAGTTLLEDDGIPF